MRTLVQITPDARVHVVQDNGIDIAFVRSVFDPVAFKVEYRVRWFNCPGELAVFNTLDAVRAAFQTQATVYLPDSTYAKDVSHD